MDNDQIAPAPVPVPVPVPVPSPAAAPTAKPASAESAPPARRALTYVILGAAVATALAAIGVYRHGRGGSGGQTVATVPAPPSRPAAASRPRVELVFALDTTGSMSGLIEGAKRKIWSLASFVAQGQPTPDLRVGLVAYRDLGDAYVTRVFDLDRDLDGVYAALNGLSAEGGGDTPEHVARALDEAVNKMSWSDSADVVKVIYLVGDAPPHTDYQDGYDHARAARQASAKGIQLHTIQCGTDRQAEGIWRQIASLGQGQFMAIQQNGGMHEEHTRYDEELAKLHDRLTGTAIGYGAGRTGVDKSRSTAMAAPASTKAARAAWMAREGKAVGGEGDLVESLAKGAVRLDDVPAAAMPPELRALDKDQQRAAIASKQKERDAITRRIGELGRLRQAELDDGERAAAAAGAADGFDVAAKKALRKSVAARPQSGLKL